MDIKRLKKLSGLTESVSVTENVGNEGLLRAAKEALEAALYNGDISKAEKVLQSINFELGEDDEDTFYQDKDHYDRYGDDDEPEDEINDYFDDLDAGDTEMDRRSDQRRGW